MLRGKLCQPRKKHSLEQASGSSHWVTADEERQLKDAIQASRGDAYQKKSYDAALAQAMEASRATAASEAEESEALRIAIEASLVDSRQKNLGLGLNPAATNRFEEVMELAAQCTLACCPSQPGGHHESVTFLRVNDSESHPAARHGEAAPDATPWKDDLPMPDDSIDATHASQRIIKATFGQDTRRFRVYFASRAPEEVLAVLHSTIEVGFGLPEGFATPPAYLLKYRDDEGDLCTLVSSTMGDFLELACGEGPLRIEVMKASEGLEGFSIGTPPVSPRGNCSESCSQSIEDDYETSWSLVEAEPGL